jgi:phosphodiesterase/alkaline phosphatase D-like protein
VEDWLIKRTMTEDTTHFLHVPSLPFAYSSGKLGDWYPDLLDKSTGKLVTSKEKQGWQRGWFGQHQRLIAAIASQTKRPPVVVQGDFHASAAGSIHRSGELILPRPINVVLSGTLGSGDLAFPSSMRGVESTPSQMIGMDEAMKITEKNGFSIIDVTPEKMTFTMFMYRPPQDPAEIDTMKAAFVYEVPRNT